MFHLKSSKNSDFTELKCNVVVKRKTMVMRSVLKL